jgi:hypothetical protein
MVCVIVMIDILYEPEEIFEKNDHYLLLWWMINNMNAWKSLRKTMDVVSVMNKYYYGLSS